MPTDPRRALRAASVLVGAVWLPVILLWGPLPHAITFDDSWYYFGIGRNVADGLGSTWDGIHATNGYHPLWMLICAAAFLVGLDGMGAVRTLLVAQLAMWVGTLWIFAGLVADRGWSRLEDRDDAPRAGTRCTLVVAAIWFVAGANPYILKMFVNGMESALVGLTVTVVLALAVREDGDPVRRPVFFTVAICVAFLARTDAVLWVGALLVWTAVRRRRIDRQILAVGAVFSAVVAAYLVSNLVIVGHLMQISGHVKRQPLNVTRAGGMAVLTLVALAVGWAGLRAARSSAGLFPRTKRWFASTAWFAAALVLATGYYTLLSAESYLWHFAPHALWALGTLLHVGADMAESAVLEQDDGAPAALVRPFAVGAVLLVPLLLGGLYLLRDFTDEELYATQLGNRATGEWVDVHLPDDAVVAGYDVGVLGYFAHRPVVNLDGLVNSFEWDEARRDGTAATARFLRQAGVTHLANHGDLIRGDDPGMRRSADRLFGKGTGRRLDLVHVVRYVYSGTAGGRSGRRPYGTFVFALAPEDT